MTRAIPQAFYDFIEREEAKRKAVYDDAHPFRQYHAGDPIDGALTGGYGHTGPDVAGWIGKIIPDNVIDVWLKKDAAMAAWRLGLVLGEPTVAALTDNQYAALLSFVFNLGAKPAWGIWDLVRARNWDAVTDDMVNFDHVNGKEISGLLARREAEVKLFNTPDVIPA